MKINEQSLTKGNMQVLDRIRAVDYQLLITHRINFHICNNNSNNLPYVSENVLYSVVVFFVGNVPFFNPVSWTDSQVQVIACYAVCICVRYF